MRDARAELGNSVLTPKNPSTGAGRFTRVNDFSIDRLREARNVCAYAIAIVTCDRERKYVLKYRFL